MNKVLLFTVLNVVLVFQAQAGGDETGCNEQIILLVTDKSEEAISIKAAMLAGTFARLVVDVGENGSVISIPLIDARELHTLVLLLECSYRFLSENEYAKGVFEKEGDLIWNKKNRESLLKILHDGLVSGGLAENDEFHFLRICEYLDCRWLMPIIAQLVIIQKNIQDRNEFESFLENYASHLRHYVVSDVIELFKTELAKFWCLYENGDEYPPSSDTQELIDFGKVKSKHTAVIDQIKIVSLPHIGRLQPGSLSLFKNLQILYLTHNHLSELPPDWNKGLESLKSLVLSTGMIKSVWWGNNFNVDVINLSQNQLAYISKRWSCGLEKLKKLNLSGNKIELTESGWAEHFKSLDSLNLSENGITVLQEGWDTGLSTLESLVLRQNCIAKLTAGCLCSLKNLLYACLDQNQIGVVEPGCFKGASQLVDLDLSWNKIRRIDAECLEDVPGLKRLTLTGNNLEEDEKQIIRNALPETEIIF